MFQLVLLIVLRRTRASSQNVGKLISYIVKLSTFHYFFYCAIVHTAQWYCQIAFLTIRADNSCIPGMVTTAASHISPTPTSALKKVNLIASAMNIVQPDLPSSSSIPPICDSLDS